jgi:dUTP pyrophosphatase
VDLNYGTVTPWNVSLNIKVKYFYDDMPKLEKISKGDWIDLRVAEQVTMKKGEFRLLKLGVGMKVPDGYETIIAPRSSTFKKYGILQANSIGVVDNSYSGNDDMFMFPAYATRDVTIEKHTRICQFRLQQVMPTVTIEEVENLDEVSRGGFGSTGEK